VKRALHLDGASTTRRRHCVAALALLFGSAGRAIAAGRDEHPAHEWAEAAERMRQRALGWGDQPYGAVLVLGNAVVGEGPSRVVRNADPDAHAEREALRDAQRRLGRSRLDGAVLYSTSRPCALCEDAAARANVARMFFGPGLADAGVPRDR
jgi:tRNA(adenine34) deaminase